MGERTVIDGKHFIQSLADQTECPGCGKKGITIKIQFLVDELHAYEGCSVCEWTDLWKSSEHVR